MLTNDQCNLIWQIDGACRKCIRAVFYFNAVTNRGREVWSFTQNCFGEIAAIQWSHIFGKYKDCTHFSQLFGDPAIGIIDPKFKIDNVRIRLHTAISVNEDQYNDLWKEIMNFRDSYAAHWDYRKKTVVFPDLEKAMTLCIEMRDILRDLVVKAVSETSGRELQDLRMLLIEYNNDRQLKLFRIEAEYLKKVK